RGAQQPRSHAGRAAFALLHAGEDSRQGYRDSGGRSESARAPASGRVAALTDLGSRTGDGRAQELHDGDRCPGLLLRSAESLAARLQRKHQRPVAAVPAEERRPVYLFAIRTRAIALRLNTRPRQTLGFRTPADKLQASVASTP